MRFHAEFNLYMQIVESSMVLLLVSEKVVSLVGENMMETTHTAKNINTKFEFFEKHFTLERISRVSKVS